MTMMTKTMTIVPMKSKSALSKSVSKIKKIYIFRILSSLRFTDDLWYFTGSQHAIERVLSDRPKHSTNVVRRESTFGERGRGSVGRRGGGRLLEARSRAQTSCLRSRSEHRLKRSGFRIFRSQEQPLRQTSVESQSIDQQRRLGASSPRASNGCAYFYRIPGYFMPRATVFYKKKKEIRTIFTLPALKVFIYKLLY